MGELFERRQAHPPMAAGLRSGVACKGRPLQDLIRGVHGICMTKILISGFPKTGKSIFANELSNQYKNIQILHTDDLIENHNWKDSSDIVSNWILENEYIIEGVTVIRGLRKLITSYPHKRFDDITLYYLTKPKIELNTKQFAMAKGIQTIFMSIHGLLKERGLNIIFPKGEWNLPVIKKEFVKRRYRV